MSIGQSPPTASLAPPRDADDAPREIRVVSHSTLFYWWPVWALGFIMALVTFFSSQRMVIVSRAAEHFSNAAVTVQGKVLENQSVWTAPAAKASDHVEMVRISPNKNIGVLFTIILLLVIAITNVPLRGLWSVIVLVVIVAFSIIFALLNWWEPILKQLSILDIRINFEGYLLISTVLFVLWCVVFFFFDTQIYMVFTPGQLRVRQEIGDAETSYDTTGMTVQKQRSDLFRHWILGLGSGDLVVQTAGAQAHHFEMPNVLFIGRKVDQIQRMLASRQVIEAPERSA